MADIRESTKLLPCPNPWCYTHEPTNSGSPFVDRLPTGQRYRVKCPYCPMVGAGQPSREKAIAAWNNRPKAAPTGGDSSVARLREAVPSGHHRQFIRCPTHGRVGWYDYVPYSFSTAIGVMPCGCDSKNAETITEDEHDAALAPATASIPADVEREA